MSDNRGCGLNIGVGFLELLALAFIILKLTGYIDWSWVWVLCPLWAGIALFVVVLFGAVALAAAVAVVAGIVAGVTYICLLVAEWWKKIFRGKRSGR